MFCLLSATLNIQIKKSRLCLTENGKHGKYLHTFLAGCVNKGSPVSSALLIVIVLCSRIKSLPQNLWSSCSKNSLSVSKLDSWKSKLKTLALNCDPRFSKHWGSSFESRLSTYFWPVLYVKKRYFSLILKAHLHRQFLLCNSMQFLLRWSCNQLRFNRDFSAVCQCKMSVHVYFINKSCATV